MESAISSWRMCVRAPVSEKVDKGIDIDALTFYTLNKHTSPEDISGYLKPLVEGQPMGVISEAGCPAVADPGADVVAIAQRKT